MLNAIKNNRGQLKLMICSFLVSYIALIVGCSYVYTSILLSKLKEPSSSIRINEEMASWIASVPILVSPVGLIVIGILTDKIGRKKSIQIAYIPMMISWLTLAYSTTLESVVVGRIMLGSSLSSASYVYVYLAEVCPTQYRVLYLSVVTVFVGVGMIMECVLAMFFQWQTVSAILFVLCCFGFVSMFLVPESPAWLRAHGRIYEAEQAEIRLGIDPPPSSPSTVTAVATANNGDVKEPDVPYWKLFTQSTVWKPTLITLAFFVCQQGSGFYVLLFYSIDVLHDCRVQWDGITVTIFLSVARVIGSMVFSMLHKVRRKTLTVVSSVGMALSLIVIIIYMKTYKEVDEPPYGMTLIVAFVAYVFFSLLSILPLPWTLCGEVFPMAVKGTMCGIVQVIGFELMFIVIKIYPSLVLMCGIENVWSVFAGFCVLSALYGAFIMPETKGKSLDEILTSFKSHKKPPIENRLP
ncbi:Sugar/inositol transporter,Major facilitator superfamily domain,Major facilitator, sugar transporter- [Cinara cedri]|uniref:Sugar/inositol transporter,Major facilitator superfamily domain,Major facilitator, sugar transporter n=1 Tax=Cinara cedri TaxID=506608 RepID=A0A5E4MEA2_9HEMI|nr:Sugar/inositol transporter,Major facilitator superfamily domain,Major facilitator, sugar transporter- [Cinara cedri]